MSLPEWCPPYSSRRKSPITGEEVYCTCKKTDSGELMVGCDGCDDWFHFSCLKISEEYKELVFSFYCPYCQAGITGPASRKDNPSELPRTIWKRKCRLHDCYKECQSNGKYCSPEHGEKYMKKALSKLKIVGVNQDEQKEIVKSMAEYTRYGNTAEGFQQIGKADFINEEIEGKENPELYKQIVSDDSKLEELAKNYQEAQNITIPETKKKTEILSRYLEWLDDVNKELFSLPESLIKNEDDKGFTGRRKKNLGKTKQKKSICGYTSQLDKIPCSVEEFKSQYDGTNSPINGICTKLRCNKHFDWSSMLMEQYTHQLRSLQAFQERLQLLIKTRKEQLHIQYYEQLLRRKD